jgi:hypothetical protein
MVTKHLFLGLALAFMVVAGNSFADGDVALNPDAPNSYTVVEGDTLWDISGKFLQHPWQWPDIWQVNPQVENPHLIFPGDVLSLTYGPDGKPMIGLKRSRDVKLSPKARASALDRAIPTIPLNVIHPFLTRPQILTEAEIEDSGYIVSASNEHIMGMAGEKVYVRKIKDTSKTKYNVYRRGETYFNPMDPKDVLGIEAIYVATGNIQRFGDPATLHIVENNREALVGDRLIPAETTRPNTHFMPRAPEKDIEGSIIAVHDGVDQVGPYNVVALSLGTQDGLEVGHVLRVWQAGRTVEDQVTPDPKDTVTLPDEPAGYALVFRTFGRVSYALINKASTNIHVLDKVRTPKD